MSSASLEYDAELAPELVKLLSGKLNDARQALRDSTQENEDLREQLRKQSEAKRSKEMSRDSERLQHELDTINENYDRLQDELAGTRLQLQACVENMGADNSTDVKPCVSGACPAGNAVSQLRAEARALTDQLSAQQTSHEEESVEWRQQIERYRAKYKKYKRQVQEYEATKDNQASLDVQNTEVISVPDKRIHEPCLYKTWAVCAIHQIIKSPLNGTPIFRRRGLFIPHNGRYDQALLVVPAMKCTFVDGADTSGSWSTVCHEFLRSLEDAREIFYSTRNGTCYAGTFSCASQGEYSLQEFHALDFNIQEEIISWTVQRPAFYLCSALQKNMIRGKYRDGIIRAVYLHLAYQGFNGPLFEELSILKAYHERRDEEWRAVEGSRKRNIADEELGEMSKKPKKPKKSGNK